jgi:glyoxylase-like metal-dependent hydrolase (beta-lactamase superfamily II)
VKLFTHFAVPGFSNTYLFGPDDGGDAVNVDPGIMDLEILTLIEENSYYVRHILLTTPHIAHYQGLETLLKIYNADIFSGAECILEHFCRQVRDGDSFMLGDFRITVYNVSGHSKESVVFRVEDCLFTGDALGAGKIGDSPNSYARAILNSTIHEKIEPLDDHLLIFPGHGPPTTLEAERRFNPAFSEGA